MAYVTKVTAGGNTEIPVASSLYGVVDHISSNTLLVNSGNVDSLVDGLTMAVRFDVAPPQPLTSYALQVNNTGAKTILTSGYTIQPIVGDWLTFIYQATSDRWHAIEYWQDTTYSTLTSSELTAGTSTATRVVTPKVIHDYVASQMSDVAGALVYKGTVSAGSELLNTALSKGWYYIVDTAGSYAGATCEPGDMVIVNTAGTYTTASALGAAVDIIQTNIDTISNSEIDTIVAS